jgi:hypothetical protein
LALVFALVAVGAVVGAQEKPAGAPKVTNVPLQVQIVIARFQGEKRISNIPYTLTMNYPGRANLRLNADMPMPMSTISAGDAKQEPVTSFTMRPVGTNIDVSSVSNEAVDGRYALTVTVSETWFQPADTVDRAAKNLAPVSRTYQSANTVQVRDGEIAQVTAATDRATGEVIRIEVTARAVK